jgi:hypothetical protein
MPNACETDLTITAPVAIIEKIRTSHFYRGALSLDSVIGVPYYPSDDARIQAQNDSWGTDRPSYDAQPLTITPADDGNATLFASFTNAWQPPIPVFHALAKLYPEARITSESYERGTGYHVSAAWVAGTPYRFEKKGYSGTRGG